MDRYYIDEYNLLEILDDEINKYGSNWTSKEKADYIYIRMCQLFNYDERWRYTKNIELRNKIFDKYLDITKVDTKKLVCSSFTNAFADVVNTLLVGNKDFDCVLTYGEESHMYSGAFLSGTICTYDPIFFTDDFLNSKKNLPIKGIKINNMDDWKEEIVQAKSFRKIGYSNNGLKKLKNIRENALNNSSNNEEFFDYLIKNLDFSDLGIYESNNLLNMQAKIQYNKNFNNLGINFDHFETSDNEIIYTYSYNNKDRYEMHEDKGKVKVLKL